MTYSNTESIRKVLIGIFIYAILSVLTAYSIQGISAGSWYAGHLLGMVTVILHLISSYIFGRKEGKQFLKAYFWSLIARFFGVCFIYAMIIIWTEIEEISFTFSFVISYLFHSVIEVIFLNNKLLD
ncbi:MAG: hypothetical protein EA391_08745 [Balneolaceae bacterium]|nr:MAG: hypothetical protein EA391_08745 [Balneolaceae bacterium]